MRDSIQKMVKMIMVIAQVSQKAMTIVELIVLPIEQKVQNKIHKTMHKKDSSKTL